MPPKGARPARPAAPQKERAARPPFGASPGALSPLGYSPLPANLAPFPGALPDPLTPHAPQTAPDASRTAAELRAWRDRAADAHMHDEAAFWGDKVLTMTYDPADALALGQIYFRTGQYTRAERLLSHPALLDADPQCRYLAALCSVRLEKFSDALLLLGEQPEGDFAGGPEERRLESAISHVRALAYSKMNDMDRTKACHMAAVKLDVRCFESFNILISNHMMTGEEEREFLASLDFDSQLGPEGELVRLLYTAQIRKSRSGEDVETPIARLEADWRLAFNPDLNAARAESLYAASKYQKALDVTSRILDYDPHNLSVLPLHVACLHELGRKHQLFYLAHELVARYPDKAVTWFAVGSYYLLAERGEEARRYFAKATLADNSFGPAWIGFAHAFVKEGEHDQAIAAYATASKLFRGMHLPIMYIGVQHLMLGNAVLAEEYLLAAHELAPGDPALHNELGALYYSTGRYAKAIESYKKALELGGEEGGRGRVSEPIWGNLGHAYRRIRDYASARTYLEKALAANPANASAHAGLGMVAHAQGDLHRAVACYHRALAIEPDELYAEMLQLALEELPADPPRAGGAGGMAAAAPEAGAEDEDMAGHWVPEPMREWLVEEQPLPQGAGESPAARVPSRKGKEPLEPRAADEATPVSDRRPPQQGGAGAKKRLASFASDGSFAEFGEGEEDGEGVEDGFDEADEEQPESDGEGGDEGSEDMEMD
ncbi:hypothetical protein DFJ74DRAFT_744467 [Hyaloraphidium curvatum]|nr:hypothetical protein DFJ74DRAFT_744467 [Hyaloraphidium curvatum]